MAGEGTPLLQNYDITADVGPMTAVVKTYDVPVSDGVLTLAFTASVNRPIISAIAVSQLSGPPAPTATSEPATATPTSVPATATPTTPPSGSVVARINAGGPAVTTGGVSWSADQDYVGGKTYQNAIAIANTTDDVLYQTERSAGSAQNYTFSYAIPVPTSGTYQVRLHFAEIYWGAPGGGSGGAGKRVFSVNLEGGTVELPSYDINADVGPATAVVKSFEIPVTDGTLDIHVFRPGTADQPKLSAIEVLQLDTPTATSVPATATATPVPPPATATATSVPPTATATATSVPPTATATATPVPPTATATRTATPVPPTATATYTATPVPPTATRTATPVPPTATRTPTATSGPPTATRTATPIMTPTPGPIGGGPCPPGQICLDPTSEPQRPQRMALGAATPAVTVHHYTYDGLGRLTQEALDGGSTTDYAYDPVGNRTGVWLDGTQTVSRAYNDANQVVGWTYDAAGNLLSDGTQQHTWDALNRLVQTQVGSSVTQMQYNGDGILVAQTQAGVTTRYTQDLAAPLSQILQVQTGSSTTAAIYGLGAERLATISGSAWSWPLVDALGTPTLTLDNTGAPLTANQSDAWGVPSAGTTPDPFGFTGELHNPDTGLVYLRARWYQPGEGTLLGRDPFAGYDQQPYSLHPYQYALSNPVSNTDPSGRCIEWVYDVANYVRGGPLDGTCQVSVNPADWDWDAARRWVGEDVPAAAAIPFVWVYDQVAGTSHVADYWADPQHNAAALPIVGGVYCAAFIEYAIWPIIARAIAADGDPTNEVSSVRGCLDIAHNYGKLSARHMHAV